MHLATRFYPMIKQRQGSILIIGSIGVFGLTRTLGDAWGREGVRVNAAHSESVPWRKPLVLCLGGHIAEPLHEFTDMLSPKVGQRHREMAG
jgi:hypothetical protein